MQIIHIYTAVQIAVLILRFESPNRLFTRQGYIIGFFMSAYISFKFIIIDCDGVYGEGLRDRRVW